MIDEQEPNESDHGRKDGVPLPFNCPTEVYKLYTGDYSIKGLENLFAIEKKTLGDYISSIGGKAKRDKDGKTRPDTKRREVFKRELIRLNAMDFSMLLIIARPKDIKDGNYKSNYNPKSAWNTLEAFSVEFPSVRIKFVDDEEAAAREIEKWAGWYAYKIGKLYKALVRGSPHLKGKKKLELENDNGKQV